MWIVHYSQAEPADRIPANVIPLDMRQNQSISVRQHLQQQGQIVQKDFMLHDRTNWPQIAFPRGRPQGQQPMYGGNAPPARIPQAMAYPPQPQPGPPAKRHRAAAAAPPPGNPAAVLDIDDEEDTSRGDLFDHVTPREISVARYKQNHEWMEEILSSPYAMHQLVPADLGLGLRGQLSTLTAEFFHAPVDPDQDVQKMTYVGKLDPGKADEFRKRTAERVAKENKEIEKMKARHERRLAKFQKGKIISNAEKELRNAVHDPENTGPEIWRLEGRVDDDDKEDEVAVKKAPVKVADIVAQVEASLGRHARAVEELIRIQAGGYEEPSVISPQQTAQPHPINPPAPASNNGSNHSGHLIGDTDIDMGNSAGGMLDEFHTGLSSHPTPGSNSFPTPQAHIRSATGTPGLNTGSPAPVQQPPNLNLPEQNQAHPAQGNDVSDWVVVPPGGRTPSPNASNQQAPQHPQQPGQDPPQQQQQQQLQAQTSNHPSPAVLQSTSAVNTPGSGLLAPSPSAHQAPTAASTPLPDFHASSPNDFADLGDLDSAGDALAGYADEMDVGADDFGGLVDDSAFGEAFHAGVGGGAEEGEDGGL